MITETQILYLEDGTIISPRTMSINFTYNATESHTQTLDMLHPSFNYTVTMAAVTNVGKSPYSEPITVTMLMAGMLLFNCTHLCILISCTFILKLLLDQIFINI